MDYDRYLKLRLRIIAVIKRLGDDVDARQKIIDRWLEWVYRQPPNAAT